jgi:DNA primase
MAGAHVRGRQAPLTRLDHIARVLLSHGELWLELGNEDHHLLCEQPAPHGPLFAWLESQLHEHGEQPWAALHLALESQPFEGYASTLMARQLHDSPLDENRQELRSALRLLTIQHLEALSAEASRSSNLEQLREINARIRSLKTSPA